MKNAASGGQTTAGHLRALVRAGQHQEEEGPC